MAECILKAGQKYYLENEAGEQKIICELFDVENNNSPIPTHVLHEKEDGQLEPYMYTQKLVDALFTVLPQEALFADRCTAILRLLAYCRRKPAIRKILYAGDVGAWSEELVIFLKLLGEENKIYWVTGKNEFGDVKNAITVTADFLELPLPQDYFDVVVWEKSGDVTQEQLGQVVGAVKAYGLLLLLTAEENKRELSEFEDYILDKGRAVFELLVTPTIKSGYLKNSLAYSVREIKGTFRDGMKEVGGLLEQLTDEENYAALLGVVKQLEDYLLVIYPYLMSTEIKYRMSRLKEVMLEYYFGYGNLAEVQKEYEAVQAEMNRFGDFADGA